jgi:3-hydroxyacyl-[acyl-carrier-protein] dehydratase
MNDFYHISELEQGEGSLRCVLHFNTAHSIFQGHFPDNPIVPGVCTMAIIKELLEEAIQQKLMLKESRTVKFLGLIHPAMSPDVTLSWKEESGHISMTASLQEGTIPLFRMSGIYIRAMQ